MYFTITVYYTIHVYIWLEALIVSLYNRREDLIIKYCIGKDNRLIPVAGGTIIIRSSGAEYTKEA